VVAALAGALFGVGLLVSGMADPANVLGFLDVTRAWNPALAFVMAGAIAVYAPVVWLVRARRAPLLDSAFHWPTPTKIDVPLVAGAALFGVGWGLVGYCPGPAIVSLGSGAADVVIFVAAMVAGGAVVRVIAKRA